MGTFGLRLRGERESRRLSRVDVAKATRVRVHHLCALEHEDFDDLPEDGSAEDYLRTYAEYLGLDAEACVAEFLADVQSRRPPPEDPPADEAVRDETDAPPQAEEIPPAEAAEPIAEAPPPVRVDEISIEPAYMADEPPRVEELPPRPTRRGPRPMVTATVALAAVVLVIVVLRGIGGTAETPAPADTRPAELSAPAEVTHDAPAAEPEVAVEALVVETQPIERELTPPPVQPASTTAPASGLSISDHGVGTAIVNKRLVGASDSFGEGTRVWFWTRVTGGRAGDRIEHVWIHEGRVMQRAGLELGGAHWRTQSKKTLFPGSAGSWVVEARDAAGNLLARREFSCTR